MKYFIFLLSCFTSTAFAEQDKSWSEDIQVHGFASQAFVYTTDNNFFGDSEHGSFDFTELGLNTSLQLSPKFRLSGQLLSRRAGEFYNGSPWVDYALVDINLVSTPQYQFGAYLGRIKNPVGLYNETRDVAHTRQAIFAPQVIYFDKVRNLIMSADGVHLHSNHFLSNGNLRLRVGTGYPVPDKNVEYAYMGRDWSGKLKGDNLAVFGQVLYEHDGGRWIYSLTGARLSMDYDSTTGSILNSGELDIDYSVLSAQYNGEKWQFTTEVAFEHVSFHDISPFFEASGTDSIGFYGQLDYTINSRWQSFIRYEEFQLNKNDWDGKKTAQQTGLPAHLNYAKFWVIGGLWDIKQNLRLRTEYQFSRGSATLSPRENDIFLTKKDWDMFSISLSYRF